MSKRPAGESLDTFELRQDTPLTPKRARVEEVEDESYPPPEVNDGEDGEEDSEEGGEGNEEGEDEDDADESADAVVMRGGQQGPADGFSDLYLDTIDRCVLPPPPPPPPPPWS